MQMTLRPAEGKHQSKSLGELRRLEQLTYQGVRRELKSTGIGKDMGNWDGKLIKWEVTLHFSKVIHTLSSPLYFTIWASS